MEKKMTENFFLLELSKMDEPDFRLKILAIQLPHNFLILRQNLTHFGAQFIITQVSSVFNGIHSGSVLPLIGALIAIATLHSTCFLPTLNYVLHFI